MPIVALHHEQELLSKIANGDQHVFTTVFNHYRRNLHLFTKSLTKSEEDALEVERDLFLKIWANRCNLTAIKCILYPNGSSTKKLNE